MFDFAELQDLLEESEETANEIRDAKEDTDTTSE